jgi:hypothetical protein
MTSIRATEPAVRPNPVARWGVILICGALLWRIVRYAVGFPIWGDEAFVAVNFVLRDYAGLTHALEHGQIAPLLFLWSEEWISSVLGYSEYALRLLPFLAGLASVPVFWMLARRMIESRSALIALAFFAASYYPVRHSAEVKPYSIDLLLGAALFLLWWGVLWKLRSHGRWTLLTITAAFGAWLSFPSVFISGGGALALLIVLATERSAQRPNSGNVELPPVRKLLAPFAVFASILSISFIAMYATVGQRQAEAGAFLLESSHWEFTFPPVDEPWKLFEWFYVVHTGNMFAYPSGGHAPGSIVTFLLFVLGAITLWRRGHGRLVILLLAPLPLLFIAAALRKYPYGGSARVALFYAPAICLLAGVGIDALFRRFFARDGGAGAVRVLLIIFCIVIAGGIARDLIEPYKNVRDREMKRLSALLMDESQPNDRWIIFGDFGGSPRVPDLYQWGGTAASLRFNLARYRDGEEILWGPDPESLPDAPRATRLLVYRDNREPFPEGLFEEYFAALEARLGPATPVGRFLLGDEDEAIEIFRFD